MKYFQSLEVGPLYQPATEYSNSKATNLYYKCCTLIIILFMVRNLYKGYHFYLFLNLHLAVFDFQNGSCLNSFT